MLCDMHTHSSFSPDADRGVSIEAMAKRACELGLGYIAVTDHGDCNYWYRADEYDYPEYQASDSMMFGVRDYVVSSIKETAKLKEKYSGILCGIELGQPLQDPAAAEKIISLKELDFIIGSLHMNAGRPDFYWIDYGKLDKKELYELLDSYFDEILKMCKDCDFDVLGHLTYPLRYIEGDHCITIDLDRYREKIISIFSSLIERGKGIEINTSGLRQRYAKTFPGLDYIKLYRSLGGEILTIGSDAHRLSDIGAGLKEGAELAAEAGFRYSAVFKKRRPEFIKI